MPIDDALSRADNAAACKLAWIHEFLARRRGRFLDPGEVETLYSDIARVLTNLVGHGRFAGGYRIDGDGRGGVNLALLDDDGVIATLGLDRLQSYEMKAALDAEMARAPTAPPAAPGRPRHIPLQSGFRGNEVDLNRAGAEGGLAGVARNIANEPRRLARRASDGPPSGS